MGYKTRREMLIAGIDEAGRGPVIGPMVLAIAVIEETDENLLKTLGVKDSKQVPPEKREALALEIRKIVNECAVRPLSARNIDDMRKHASLNEIEAMEAAELISGLKTKPEKAYIDAPDVKEAEFAKRIRKYLFSDIKLVTEHYADSKYPACSAASILAKVERDRLVREIEKEHDIKIGSGYPHDPLTIKFLKDWMKAHDSYPEFVRASWETASAIVAEKKQKKLGDFF